MRSSIVGENRIKGSTGKLDPRHFNLKFYFEIRDWKWWFLWEYGILNNMGDSQQMYLNTSAFKIHIGEHGRKDLCHHKVTISREFYDTRKDLKL